MKTRALTASEATALIIEKLGIDDIRESYFIQDNDYTRKFGVSDFKYENPRHNPYNPSLAMWDAIGVRFSICISEWNGRSNVLLEMWDGSCGHEVANYNKMKAAEKKEFIEMCLTAKRANYDVPFRVWEGWKNESYRDEKGVYHTAWRTPDGILHTCRG